MTIEVENSASALKSENKELRDDVRLYTGAIDKQQSRWRFASALTPPARALLVTFCRTRKNSGRPIAFGHPYRAYRRKLGLKTHSTRGPRLFDNLVRRTRSDGAGEVFGV